MNKIIANPPNGEDIGIIQATLFKEPEFVVDPILANNDLETIQKIAKAGTGANYWDIGDKIPIELNGTISKTTFDHEVYYAFIIGFNHNPEYEGEHSIHFQIAMDVDGKQIAFTEEYGESYSSAGNSGFPMNTTNVNTGGWENSYMRQTLMLQFLNLLPDEWQSVITETKKYTDNVGGGSGSIQDNVTSTNDKVFLLGGFEVFSSNSYANSYEKNYQQQYTYYANGNDRKFYNHQSKGSSVSWWLRSPRLSYSDCFASVNRTGNADYYSASYSYGLAPAFAIA